MQIKYSWTYWYNQYAPWRIIKRYIAHKIYQYAERKYGANARGKVSNIKIVHHPTLGKIGYSDFTPNQKQMLEKWIYLMNIKNKVYDITEKTWADRLNTLIDYIKKHYVK